MDCGTGSGVKPAGREVGVKLVSAIPRCETFLMMDTCAGGGICPRVSDQTAQNNTTVVTKQLVTAPDDPVHGTVGKLNFGSRDGRKLQVQHVEGDLSFPIVSSGESSQRGNRFAGCQAMLPGLGGEHHTTRETDSNAIMLEKHRGVTEPLNGVPLCPNPETASTAVEEAAISATDSDTTTMQLEESEETRRHKHKTLPRDVNRDEYDARRIAHLQFRSRSGKAVDHAHKPRAGTHGGETKMGRNHFFEVEGGLVVAPEAMKLTDRTRLIKKGAVKNLVCNTPKASSVNAGGFEQARYEVENRTLTLRSWSEGASVDLDYKELPVVVRHCAWQITHRHVRSDGKEQIERLRRRPHNGQVTEFAEVNHFSDPQKAADMSKLHDR